MAAMTYNKSDDLIVAGAATASVVIDLGLGIEEAARILGVAITLVATGAPGAGASRFDAAISFDPEDVALDADDDEQFVHDAFGFIEVVAAGSSITGYTFIHDFSHMNLITTRDLALIGTSTVAPFEAKTKVFYEKYKPTSNELVQLISTRR